MIGTQDSRRTTATGWQPAQGSWEEFVLPWHEHVDRAFGRRGRGCSPAGARLRDVNGATAAASGRPALHSGGPGAASKRIRQPN